MTETAVLLVPRPALMRERVGGMTVLERHCWTAARAGLRELFVALRMPDEASLSRLRLPEGLVLRWAQRDGESARCQPPYLVLSGDHFLRVETLRYVREQDYSLPVSLEDAAGAAVIQVVPYASDRPQAAHKQALPPGASVFIELARRDAVIGWLMLTGTKSQDGFMARHFDRHISLAVSRMLLETPVTPNAMTVASSVIGLYGATLFLTPTHASRLAGAALIWLHSVLDGCDGELARMRFQQSAFGAKLDYWGDNLVHVLLFGCIALGFARADRSVLPLLAGGAAILGTIGSAVLMDRQKRLKTVATDKLGRLEQMLAARDFIYLLLALAYIDRVYEFLWAAGVGSVIFLGMMLYSGGQNEQASKPYPPREGQAGSAPAGDGGGYQHLHSGR